MPDTEALDRRLRAVERTISDGDRDLTDLRAAGERRGRVAELEADLADARERIAELEAATQALRGYVGNVRAVNDEVADRADAALDAAEDLEDRLDSLQTCGSDTAVLNSDGRGVASTDQANGHPASRSGGHARDVSRNDRPQERPDAPVADLDLRAGEREAGPADSAPPPERTDDGDGPDVGFLARIRDHV